MSLSHPSAPLLRGLSLAGLALGALALVNQAAARRAERRNPPQGFFIEVGGVRLHVTDRGEGPPVLLVHGNVVSGADYDVAGVVERLLPHHRVIVIDRPGFGHSERPRGRTWTARRQADLLHAAMRQLGIRRAVVVGHSWGAIVALSMAARHRHDVAGLVLVSGYYVWTLRPDVLLVALTALPGIGDLLRHTVSPWLGRPLMPLLKRSMFAPAPVTPRFRASFSDAMALRPSQIRATSEDGALMIPGVLRLRERYNDLRMPVSILAGEGDRVVFARSARRLQERIPGSTLRVLPGVGHMLHHTAPDAVVREIEAIAARGAPQAPSMVATPRAA